MEKAVLRQRKAQESRVRSLLNQCRYSKDYIELYMATGLLLRVVELTYTYYLGLLSTVRGSIYEFPDGRWKNSFAYYVVEHHARELRQIRESAADYRTFILDTYVYLRNANKDKYQDNSFTRNLLHQQLHPDNTEEPDDASEIKVPRALKDDKNRCTLCRRIGLGCGGTKETCVLAFVGNATKAREVTKGLSDAKAKKVAKALKQKHGANPNGNLDTLIQEVRASV